MAERKFDYSSTQVNFPEDSAREFFEQRKSIISNSDLYRPETMGYSDEPYVTLLYGIHATSPSLELQEVIETYPKFTVRLGNVSLFKGHESDNPFDVVKVDINCPDLYVLNKEFQEVCEYTNEFPEYIPHATIAYVKQDTCDHLEGLNSFNGISFLAEHVIFSSKDGQKRFICLGRK